jgi:hypothetical protein
MANAGELGEDIVAVGSWWSDDSQQEIDAVVLAQQGLTRVPVLVGESKWRSTVDARGIKAGLVRKATVLTENAERLKYAVCARDAVERPDDDTLAVTARDIFAATPPAEGGPDAAPASESQLGSKDQGRPLAASKCPIVAVRGALTARG